MGVVKFAVMSVLMVLTLTLPGCGKMLASNEDLDTIAITSLVSDTINEKGQRKVIITVKNNNSQIFSGLIKITSLADDGKSLLGFDGIYQSHLTPGETVKAVTWLEVDRVPYIETEVVDGVFYQLVK
ncbi:hypothetical protein [Desulfotomaculum nigrificans]|uniref:hypothetical protein n=1 Tax=Desulfotomaculum nigrificans TaxID=1565 RepID=UPI0001FAE4BF|nr:hypothetical protein [Desulfotomaculum nigrificans]